jgi:hypothetical protein
VSSDPVTCSSSGRLPQHADEHRPKRLGAHVRGASGSILQVGRNLLNDFFEVYVVEYLDSFRVARMTVDVQKSNLMPQMVHFRQITPPCCLGSEGCTR